MTKSHFKKRVFITLNIYKKGPIRSSLDVSFSSPTTVDKEPKNLECLETLI
ncbi:protein of unknown function [Streptococcus thermophilus]|nr:protein of unknown function [Streptococcus thermophilus]